MRCSFLCNGILLVIPATITITWASSTYQFHKRLCKELENASFSWLIILLMLCSER